MSSYPSVNSIAELSLPKFAPYSLTAIVSHSYLMALLVSANVGILGALYLSHMCTFVHDFACHTQSSQNIYRDSK